MTPCSEEFPQGLKPNHFGPNVGAKAPTPENIHWVPTGEQKQARADWPALALHNSDNTISTGGCTTSWKRRQNTFGRRIVDCGGRLLWSDKD